MKGNTLRALGMLVFSLALTGCTSSESSSENDKVVVEVFNIKTETKSQMDNLVQQYEAENPDVKIDVTTVGGGADATAALKAKFSSGNEPAIFMLGGLSEVETWQGYLLDISSTAAYEAAISGTLDGATIDGVSYGLPYNIEGYGWLVNKEIFQEAGIDIDDIQSFDDFESAAEILDSKKDELGLSAVFGFSGKEDWVISQYSSHFMSAAFDNDLNEALDAEDPDWGEGDIFKKYTDLMNEYNLQPIVSVDYSTSVEDNFVNGKVAIIHQGNWIVPTLDSIDETFSQEKLGIIPMFIEDGGDTGTIAAGPSWFWGINKNKDDEVVEAAKDFLDWMYTSEEGKSLLIDDFGFIPAYTGNNLDDITDPLSKTIYQYLLDGDNTVWIHNSYPNGWFQTSLTPEFQKYVAGEVSWDDFKEATTESWKDLR